MNATWILCCTAIMVLHLGYASWSSNNVNAMAVFPDDNVEAEQAIVDYDNGNEGLYGYHAKRPRRSDATTKQESSDNDERDDQYVVMPKRAALLLDRIMTALRNAVDEKARHTPMKHQIYLLDDGSKALQRRHGGQDPGQLYWKCYFNPVTCF